MIAPTVKDTVSELVALPPVIVVRVALSVELDSSAHATAVSLDTAVHVEIVDASETSEGNAIVM